MQHLIQDKMPFVLLITTCKWKTEREREPILCTSLTMLFLDNCQDYKQVCSQSVHPDAFRHSRFPTWYAADAFQMFGTHRGSYAIFCISAGLFLLADSDMHTSGCFLPISWIHLYLCPWNMPSNLKVM